MYLHFLCKTGWETEKKAFWNALQLWMIDEALRPIWADVGGKNGSHPFLPCEEKRAWGDVQDMIQRL